MKQFDFQQTRKLGLGWHKRLPVRLANRSGMRTNRQIGSWTAFGYNVGTVVYRRSHMPHGVRIQAGWASVGADIESEGDVWVIL